MPYAITKSFFGRWRLDFIASDGGLVWIASFRELEEAHLFWHTYKVKANEKRHAERDRKFDCPVYPSTHRQRIIKRSISECKVWLAAALLELAIDLMEREL